MGTEHAHYVIVDAGGHRVWSRWGGAGTFYGDLLRGPDRLAAFVREQEHGHALGWGDAVRWQAVAVLDVSRRLLLVHCSLEIRGPVWRTSVPEIRAWLGLLAARWPGWTVKWAARGLHEVMEHLGLGYDTVAGLDDPPAPLPPQWGQGPAEDDDLSVVADTLVAVRDTTGRLSFAGWWGTGLARVLLAGPAALLSPQERATPFAALEAVPWNGVHLDAAARTLDWWSLDCSLPPSRPAERWPGWRLTCHQDAFEEVAALAAPELLLDLDGPDAALRRVTEWFGRPAR
ncbi:hypothetical protein ACWEJ6_29625 [Nonomuraea sp. NPDC004702]